MHDLKKLTRTGTGVVLLLAFAVVLRQPSTKAAIKTAPPARAYYLTQAAAFNGSQALNACTTGYHMASLWEIHEPSILRYDTSLGFAADDSGSAPPNEILGFGWVRTGGPRLFGGPLPPGTANCANWTSSGGTLGTTDFGSVVGLSDDWSSSNSPNSVSPWAAEVRTCDSTLRVWCVQD
jgi:hypothetical protein